jgi:hypothetical protein
MVGTYSEQMDMRCKVLATRRGQVTDILNGMTTNVKIEVDERTAQNPKPALDVKQGLQPTPA